MQHLCDKTYTNKAGQKNSNRMPRFPILKLSDWFCFSVNYTSILTNSKLISILEHFVNSKKRPRLEFRYQQRVASWEVSLCWELSPHWPGQRSKVSERKLSASRGEDRRWGSPTHCFGLVFFGYSSTLCVTSTWLSSHFNWKWKVNSSFNKTSQQYKTKNEVAILLLETDDWFYFNLITWVKNTCI
jgi:hypothetical protein